jgi:hypothetical protein
LDDLARAAAQTVQGRDRELAALRHAVLDAARFGSKINSERVQVECQTVDGWKRLISTLLHTPLSLAQRGVVTEIVSALESWKTARPSAANGIEFQVEFPDLVPCEFNGSEVIDSALVSVREHVERTGAKVRTTLIGPVPASLYGNPQHIHQLITMLAGSLLDCTQAESLDLQLSFETKEDAPALILSFLLPPTSSADSVQSRLRNLTQASEKLRAVRTDDAELSLASAWQLALALGGSPTIEATSDGKVRMQISLPLPKPHSPEPGH